MEAAWGQDAPRPLQPTEVQVSLLHSQLSKHSAPCITSLGILSLQELIQAWYRKNYILSLAWPNCTYPIFLQLVLFPGKLQEKRDAQAVSYGPVHL